MFELWATASDAIRCRVKELIHICGCNAKAWQKNGEGLGAMQTTKWE